MTRASGYVRFCNKVGKPMVRNKVALKLQDTLKELRIERAALHAFRHMAASGLINMPEFQQKLRRLFIGKNDRLFLFMLCKSCMEISTVPLVIPKRIVQPPKFELVG